MVKRRGFLKLLGIVPVVGIMAKEAFFESILPEPQPDIDMKSSCVEWWTCEFNEKLIDQMEWKHTAISRHDGIETIYLNGKVVGTRKAIGDIPRSYTDIINDNFEGMIDELRVTENIPRYVNEFVPKRPDASHNLTLQFNQRIGSS